ncbi:hypothetical protein CHH28_05035 [Bacterioplanes sanyensis]|uniref:APCDD1 domain-containing protein n=1 Tax=Bacterioplanes sanyensis TaxID=1249553 RepID=A0A222FIN0_9GAMM|nr:hypothetical protein [Bacterioplanes sanyensis]ASP38083.1 hypothetical protein CHH28_05035 [Bacterioplanes sanyensis]
MQTNKLTLLALVLSSSMLVACGGGGSSSSSSDEPTPPVDNSGDNNNGGDETPADGNEDGGNTVGATGLESLQGTWVYDCEAVEGGSGNTGSLTFDGDNYSYVIESYEDSSCTNLEVVMTFSGTHSFEGTQILSSGQTVIKTRASDVTAEMAPQDAEWISAMNQSNTCGADWEIGKKVDITNCAALEMVHTELTSALKNGTIFHVDGDVMYTGQDDMSGSAGYPTQLSTRVHTRVAQ